MILDYFSYVLVKNDHFRCSVGIPKGANPQRVSTEFIIEIKQLNSGRMAHMPLSKLHGVPTEG